MDVSLAGIWRRAMNEELSKTQITVAFLFCVACVIYIGWAWQRQAAERPPPDSEVSDQAEVEEVVSRYRQIDGQKTPTIRIPTGVYLGSVDFASSSDVTFAGFVWQRYSDDLPEEVTRGFLFPDRVRPDMVAIEEVYRVKRDGYEVVGWYFDVTVRQNFEYDKYPLDWQHAWLRIWPQDFGLNVVLTPDFDAYDAVDKGEAFGMDDTLVAGGWAVRDSYFDYRLADYDTNFGLGKRLGEKAYPELHFNVIMTRDFLDVFVIHMVPMVVVAILLFGLLLSMTTDEQLSERFGFDNLAVLGATSALLFVIVIAHTELRESFRGAGVLYIESFYYVLYLAMVLVSINAYLYSVGPPGVPVKYYVPSKLLYWPVLLGSLALATMLVL